MSPNMGALDCRLRAVVALGAIVLAVAIGAGSAAAIALFVLAAVMAATSLVGFCPLYTVFRFDTRSRRLLSR